MYLRLAASVVTLITAVSALQVRSPTNGAEWDLSKKHSVTWTSVSTDPLTFAIELVNLSKYPPFTMKLARGVKTSAGAYTTWPMPNVTPGEAYQFNFVSDDPSRPGILAQSQQFTVIEPTGALGSSEIEIETMEPSTDSKTETQVITTSVLPVRYNNTASRPTRSSSRPFYTSTASAPVSSRRSSTVTAKATKSSPPQRTKNAAPTIEAYSGAGSLLLAVLALIA